MQDEQQPAPAEQENIDSPQVETPEPQENDAPPPRRSVRDSLADAFAKDLDAPEDTELKADPEGPARGPDGKFVAKDKPEGESETGEQKAEPEPKEEKPKTEFSEPPSRFSADAKEAWAKAPDSVKAEAHRAIREMEAGLQQKDEALKPLEQFIDMAQKSGTTLDRALQGYVNLETMLRQDPVKGLTELAKNLGKSPQELGQMLAGQEQSEGQDPRDQKIQQLEQKIQQLEGNFNGVSQTVQQQREAALAEQINDFAEKNPRFDELSTEIARMLETGYASDLQDAYNKADKLNPAPQATPQEEPAPQPAPAQTRQPKSLTGAPSPGSNPASSRAPSKSPREALERVFRM